MCKARFLQIHSLRGYSAVLLNRDDSGLAKRIVYGGASRTRISSQCLKRHWRVASSRYALQKIDGTAASVRSRKTVTRRVVQPLIDEYPEAVTRAIEAAFQTAVYGEKGTDPKSRQPLLLGEPEIQYLASEARKIAEEHGQDPKAAKSAAAEWLKESKRNLKEMRSSCAVPGGIAAALFGRMVTSDVEANIDAAIHVAHAFTVHAEDSESDYFTVVDDLREDEDDHGADHIGETELSSGLFYGYVVVDRDTLLANLGGDTDLAGEVVKRLVRLIATVTPGAKLGPTAPYTYASWMMVEAGDHQPRSLAEAFRNPCPSATIQAEKRVRDHLNAVDDLYETGEARRFVSLESIDMPGAERAPSLRELATWADDVVKRGTA